jgi:hypothetical protein
MTTEYTLNGDYAALSNNNKQPSAYDLGKLLNGDCARQTTTCNHLKMASEHSNVNCTRQSTIHDPLRMTSKDTLDVQCARLLSILFEDTHWRSSYFGANSFRWLLPLTRPCTVTILARWSMYSKQRIAMHSGSWSLARPWPTIAQSSCGYCSMVMIPLCWTGIKYGGSGFWLNHLDARIPVLLQEFESWCSFLNNPIHIDAVCER